MRFAICDRDAIFVEALAFVLTREGAVVTTSSSVEDAARNAARSAAGVCVLDVATAMAAPRAAVTRLAAAAPHTRFVLLSDGSSDFGPADFAELTVSAVTEKRRGLVDVLRLLDRVGGDEQAGMPIRVHRAAPAGRTDRGRIVARLSPREREVLCALVRGDDTKALTANLGISATTARSHVQSVLAKLDAHSRVAAATTAVRLSMVDPSTAAWIVPESA